MYGKKSAQGRSSFTGGRRRKGGAGRKELEDPITQVSALQGLEDRITPEGFLSSPQKGKYISNLSQSPSPPLGKTKKQTTKEDLKILDVEGKTDDDEETVLESSVDAQREEPKIEQEQDTDQVKEADTHEVPLKADSIRSFLQELEREIQRCGPVPKCPRQASRRACRFELPIDAAALQDLSVVDYLLVYCVVSPNKEQSYQKIYQKHCRMRIEDALKTEHLQAALEDYFCQMFGRGEVNTLLDYLDWKDGNYVQEKTFIAMVALFERILCQLDKTSCEGENGREELEVADFSGLDERLEGLNLNPSLKKLLDFIQS